MENSITDIVSMCPFCNGEAEFLQYEVNDQDISSVVQCKNCTAMSEKFYTDRTIEGRKHGKELALKAWEMRSTGKKIPKIYKIDNGDIFHGTLDQFKDNFFDNVNDETLKAWCDAFDYTLEIIEPIINTPIVVTHIAIDSVFTFGGKSYKLITIQDGGLNWRNKEGYNALSQSCYCDGIPSVEFINKMSKYLVE